MPEASTVPPPVSRTDQVTLVLETPLMLYPNFIPRPAVRVTAVGAILREAGAATVTVAVPFLLVFWVLAAVTV